MAARANGKRVLYQPKSEVIHFEGQSYAGEDQSLQLQQNNISFVERKMEGKPAHDHLSPLTPRHIAMSNADRSPSPDDLARRQPANSTSFTSLLFPPIR